MPELTQTIVNEYIRKIIVYAPDKSGGKRQQRIVIHFNFVNEVNYLRSPSLSLRKQPMDAERRCDTQSHRPLRQIVTCHY